MPGGGTLGVDLAQDGAALVVVFEDKPGKEHLLEIALVEFEARPAILHAAFRPGGDRVAAHDRRGPGRQVAGKQFQRLEWIVAHDGTSRVAGRAFGG